jgi:hypothetical protein
VTASARLLDLGYINAQNIGNQAFRLLFQGNDVAGHLFHLTQRLVPVEILIETDLVTDFGGIEIDPGLRDVRFDFRQEIAVDAVIEQHRFTVAQIGVGFVSQILAFFIGRIIAKIGQFFRCAIQMLKQLVEFIAAEF